MFDILLEKKFVFYDEETGECMSSNEDITKAVKKRNREGDNFVRLILTKEEVK